MFETDTDGRPQILVGIDGSESSLRAGAYAVGLARRQGARVVCLYVSQISPMIAMNPAATAAALESNRAVADDLRARVREFAPQLGIEATFLERQGRPLDELIRVADELRVDGVVIGASMSGNRRLVGSIAMRLVKAARWPVTVVP